MKSFKRIFLFIFVFFLLTFGIINIFLFLKGKEILSARLSQAVGREIKFDKIRFKLPFSITIDGLTIDGLSPAKETLIKLGFSNIFRSEFMINRLVLRQSTLSIVRNKDGQTMFNGLKPVGEGQMISFDMNMNRPPSAPAVSSAASVDLKKKKSARIVIRDIILEKGELTFLDEKVDDDQEAFRLKQAKLENLTVRVKDVILPLESKAVTFRVKGMLSLPDYRVENKLVKANGWVDVVKKDMKSDFSISENDETASLQAHLVSKNNELKVSGNIKISNFLKGLPKKDQGESIDGMIFGALSSMGVEMGLDFAFVTKMDQPELTNVSFKGNVVTKQPLAQEKKDAAK